MVLPVRTCVTFMPRVSLPEQSRTKAMRSRWFGSMLAWILNTKADSAGSVAVTVRLSALCARGGKARAPSALSRSPTPKFFSALPNKIGVMWPSVKACRSNGLQPCRARSSSSLKAAASRLAWAAASSAMLICLRQPAAPASPSSSRTPPVLMSIVPMKSRPRPIGQVIGAASSASVFSISSIKSKGSRLSRSILLMKVMIGMSRSRHTSNSLRVRGSMPRAASITITAESTAVSVR